MADPVSYQVGGLVVEIVEGDITALQVDAIANAANSGLWMGSGVAGAIKAAGGPAIEDEAVSRGPIPVGTAVATAAGRLPFEYIIHGAVMGMDLRTDAELVEETTKSCLALAEQLRLRSVGLPAFGTGVGGVAVSDCARAMLAATRAFAEGAQSCQQAGGRGDPPRSVERIVLCLFGKAAFAAFLSEAQSALAQTPGSG